MRRVASLAIVAALSGPAWAEEVEPVSLIAGTWATTNGAQVTFLPCDEGECGHLSRLIVPEATYAANKEAIDEMGVINLTDGRNPDPALKARPLLGLPIVILGKKVSPVRYEGSVYNPEDGNSYAGIVELIDAETLRLTGCAYMILCQSQEWKRVPEEQLAAEAAEEDNLPGNVGVWHPPEATEETEAPAATAPAPAAPAAPAAAPAPSPAPATN